WSEEDRMRLLPALAETFAVLGEGAYAEALWRQLAERKPADLEVRFRLLERALQGAREDEVIRLLVDIRRIEGDVGPVSAYGEAARLVVQARKGTAKQLEEAHALLARAAELRPSWSRVPLLEGEVYELENRKEKALEKYQA